MKKKWIIRALALLLLAGAVFSSYQIYRKLQEYRVSEEASQQLQQYIDVTPAQPTAPPTRATESTPATEPDPTQPTAEESVPTEPTQPPVVYPSVDFDSLLQINEDVVGWIYIDGTRINYPIVQGEDNRHYVSTMVDGRVNGAGSIFLDYRNSADFSDKHTVIYGHNMRNGTMFADILEYKDPEFQAAHPMGMLMTPGGNCQFEVVAGYVASLADPAWQLEFVSDKDFEAWVEETMSRSMIKGTTVPEPGDRIITLSTCSYEFSEARFVLVCVVKD